MAQTLSPKQAWKRQEEGQVALVDLRPPAAFARGHPKGALSVPYSQRGLARRIETILPPGHAVVLLVEDASHREGALAQLQGSLVTATGAVAADPAAWREAGVPIQTLDEVSVRDLALLQKQGVVVLDVREPIEWEMGHVPGALLISLGTLRDRLDSLPHASRIAVICQAGVRSCTAASLLQARGFQGVANVVEGTGGYRQADLPLEFPQKSAQSQ